MWGQMPMTNMPANVMDMDDKDLEMMYPKAYFKLIPMVKVHCDRMEGKYGVFFCPSKIEMDNIVEDICKKFDKDEDDDDKDKKHKKDKCREDNYAESFEDDTRQRRKFGRRRLLRNLVEIILLNELLERRRRRRPHHVYHGQHGSY